MAARTVWPRGAHTVLSVLDFRERLIALLAILAAMRPGEIFALTWQRLEAGDADLQRVYRLSVMSRATRSLFALREPQAAILRPAACMSLFEIIYDGLIERVNLRSRLLLQLTVTCNGTKQSCGQRSVDALEELLRKMSETE